MSEQTAINASQWFLGIDALRKIIPIATRLKTLLLSQAVRETGTHFIEYVPWMAVSSKRAELKSLFNDASVPMDRGLLTNPVTLKLLKSEFVVSGRHSLAAIVPYDITADILIPEHDELEKWGAAVNQAKGFLHEEIPWMANLYDGLISGVVPIEHHFNGKPKKRGFSTPLCFGAIFLSFQDRDFSAGFERAELAIDLAHELGHHVLHLYQSADRIITSDLKTPVYSGVRKELRPAIMSFHASAALSFMIEAARVIVKSTTTTVVEKQYAEDRLQRFLEDQRDALQALRASSGFTTLGDRIMQEFEHQSLSQ